MIKVKNNPVKIDSFPDGTTHITTESNFSHLGFCTEIVWCYDNDGELFQLQCIVDKIKNECGPLALIELTMPYIPHARMDRVEMDTDVFTLKTFCNQINAMGFSKVNVLDPHSNVSVALLDRVNVAWTAFDTDTRTKIYQDMNQNGSNMDILYFYPDEGAKKKYEKILNHEHTYGVKRRDWATGRITSYEIADPEMVKGKTVFIIDDICSYGGTFYFAAKALKEAGAAEVYLYIDHCENSVLKGDMIKSDLIEAIYTTDSIFTGEHEKIKIVNSYRN